MEGLTGRKGRRGSAAIERAIDLMAAVVRDDGATRLSDLAKGLGLPLPTAYRMVAAFERKGLLARGERGRYGAGLGLAELVPHIDAMTTLARASRPALRRLARGMGLTAHLGVLEADMVTYLVKEVGGSVSIFTREAMQLEAYCSGIGKVLLAHLQHAAREAYLAGGPFVPLTATTLTEPKALRAELNLVRARGYAIDREEIAEDLCCLAVPVRNMAGDVVAALSVSGAPTLVGAGGLNHQVGLLSDCANRIGRRLGAHSRQERAI